jgi:alpha-mannosidase
VVFDYPDEWDLSNIVVEDADGNTYPVEVTLTREDVSEGGLAGILPEPSRLTHDAMFGPDFAKVAFTVRDVPAFGYEIYRLTEDADATQDGVSVAYDGDTATLENDHYRVDIDGSAGAVASLYDKDIDREFVPDDEVFGGLPIETEAPHGMSAWIRGQVVETEDLNSGWRVEVTEDGPARGAIRCTRSYRDSEVAVTIRLAEGSRTVDWTVDTDWRETGDDEEGVPVLSIGFPARVADPEFTYDVPFGSKKRDAAGRDVPAQEWADVSDAASGVGVTVSNDTTYGHAGEGHELSLTLVRGSYYPDPIPEMGERRFELSIRTHDGNFTDADASRHGTSFNRSPHVEQLIGSLDDTAVREREFLAVDDDAVSVPAVKAGERQDGIVVRREETAGQPRQVTVSTNWDVTGVEEVDVLERPIADSAIQYTDGEATVELGANELKTVLFTLD